MSIATLSVGCSDDKNSTDSLENQNISLSAETVIMDMNGNVSSGSSNVVTVTSSADWRLTGDVSWCTPSVTKGNTGTNVTFTADKNNAEK